jgi:CBS domain-containing protein
MARVEDILMVKGPDTIVASLTTTVLEAAKLMAEANVGSVIIREGNKVEGIFTERDLLRRVVARRKDPATLCLAEVMSSPIQGCRLEDDLSLCERKLIDGHIRHLAVIEDGALVGLIGLRDIFAAKLRGD